MTAIVKANNRIYELEKENKKLRKENEKLRKKNKNLKQQVILAQKGRNVYMKALLER